MAHAILSFHVKRLLHGVGEEVSGLDFDSIFGLAALLRLWRVYDVRIGGQVVLLIVGYCLCRSEVLLVTTELGVAVFDEGSFARVEDCALIVWAIIGNVRR